MRRFILGQGDVPDAAGQAVFLCQTKAAGGEAVPWSFICHGNRRGRAGAAPSRAGTAASPVLEMPGRRSPAGVNGAALLCSLA